MNDELTLRPIAHIKSDFTEKFGLPRQSGLASSLISEVVFCEDFCDANALRGLEGYSHIWLIWGFSRSHGWSPTVRPPRLGGNTRMGVFATRSPFRPNPLGLSSVRLAGIEKRHGGSVLIVAGADLMDGTPIYDIKPYLSFTDSHPEAMDGFAAPLVGDRLSVECAPGLLHRLSEDKRAALLEALAQDPRPAYKDDPDEVYGFAYAGHEVRFCVRGGVLTVVDIAAQM